MSKVAVDESLEFDNIFEVISHDPQTAKDFKCLSNMFIEVRDAINQQDTEISVNEALICLFHKLLEVFDTPRQAKVGLSSFRRQHSRNSSNILRRA